VLRDLLIETARSDAGWSHLRPGVDEYRLYGNNGGPGPSASILRYAPGARIPYHRHDGHEHLYVLAGSQRDDRGTYSAGTLVINPPGTAHDVVSDEGCTVLAIWERPIVFIER
jgi:anti-sigma factor ChrR (cupin superfamily)